MKTTRCLRIMVMGAIDDTMSIVCVTTVVFRKQQKNIVKRVHFYSAAQHGPAHNVFPANGAETLRQIGVG